MQSYLEKLPVGCRMLDGGCGLGDWTLYLAEKGYQVTGIDLSRSTIQVTPIHKWQGLRRMIQHDLHLDPKSKIGKAAHVLLYPFIPKSYESSRFHKGGNHDGYHPRSGLLHQNA